MLGNSGRWGVFGILLTLAVWAASYRLPEAGAQVQRPPTVRSAAQDCLTPAERVWLSREIAAYERRNPRPPITARAAPRPWPFFPVGGNLGRELWIGNYVDLDPSAAVRTWECSASAYDGHDGHDTSHGRFPCERKQIGIPVFAAMDGVVVSTRDGNFDDYGCSAPFDASAVGNQVLLDHGGGQYSFYLHLKNGSVSVTPGQSVREGAQIGLVGSSGASTRPHLHFESRFNGAIYEPFAGACRGGAGGWVRQPPMEGGPHLIEAYMVSGGVPTGTFETGTQVVGVQFHIARRPPNSTCRFRYRRPNGTVAVEPGISWNNPEYSNLTLWNYGWGVNLNATGLWHLELIVNDQLLVALPFEVVAAGAPKPNRPPNVLKVALDPPRPDPAAALFCRLQDPDSGSFLLMDPDYDLVKYRYSWRVNGALVREVVSAGRADAVPAGVFEFGDNVTCTVTPMDDNSSGPSAVARETAGGVVAGRVTYDDGSALGAVSVTAAGRTAQTDSAGDYRILGVAPGGYTVTPQRAGYLFNPSSRTVTALPDAFSINFIAREAPPAGLKAAPIIGPRILVTWKDCLLSETGYHLERRTGTGAWTELARLPANRLSYTDLEVLNGRQYEYRLRAAFAGRFTDYVGPVSAYAGAPLPPGSLRATGVSATQVRLTWTDRSSFESTVRVERRSGSLGFTEVRQLPPDTTTYTDEDLVPSTRYVYRLRASNGPLHSDYTPEAEATTWAPPLPPHSLIGETQADGSIRLRWWDQATTETGYRVERRRGTGAWAEIARLAAGSTGYVDTELVAMTLYTYRVRAVSGSRFSAYSNSALVSAGIPPAPTQVSAFALSATEVRITWADPSTVKNDFHVERRTLTGSWAVIARLLPSARSYLDTGRLPATRYQYRLRALNGSAFSPYSTVVEAATWAMPGPPTDLRAVLTSAKQVRLTWTDTGMTETGFQVERLPLGGSWSVLRLLSANTRGFTDAAVTLGTHYTYRVRAVSGSRTSAASGPASILVQ